MRIRAVALALALVSIAAPAAASLKRVSFNALNGTVYYLVADSLADLPTTGPANGVTAYVISESGVYCYESVAWASCSGSGGGGGSAIVLDLGNNGSSESTGVSKITTTGDTNAIFSEPNADELRIAVGQNWPTCDAALTGDSATAFFSAGTLEDARVDGSLEADELTLAGDTDGPANANDLDEAAVESELEGVIDLPDLQGDLPLGSKTSGNYAAGDAEAGAALTGDSATAFFSSGSIDDARLDDDHTLSSTTLVSALKIPTGNAVGLGSLYVNPATPSSGAMVGWSLEATWSIGDVGADAVPGFADLDADGDLDMMMGEAAGICLAYENTGTPASPTWSGRSGWNSPDVGTNCTPTFADLDNDGDLDAIFSRNGATAPAYENTGSASSPTWTAHSGWDIGTPSGYNRVRLLDLDGDGDFDALSGGQSGVTRGWQNVGTVSAPSWSAFSGWNVPDIGAFAGPGICDLDGDGDFDVVVGTNALLGVAYENTGSSSSPTWTANSSWDLPGGSINNNYGVELGDLDGDGDCDAMVGLAGGTSAAYENTGSAGAATNVLADFAVGNTRRAAIFGDGRIAAEGQIGTDDCIRIGDLGAGANNVCICVDSDRPYADNDCDSTKDSGEEYLDIFTGSDTWKTIDTPAGTDPVVDDPNDILTFVCTAPLTCTGNSGTDTVTFDGGIAAGTYIPATSAPAIDAVGGVWGVSGSLVYEGSGADANETFLAAINPTADRTISLPNGSGTLMTSALSTNAVDATNAVTGDANAIVFEVTADANETSLTATNPTADRTVTLPDMTGTVFMTSLSTNVADAANAVTGVSNGLLFEGATANGFETTVSVVDPTADRTISFPNESGTLLTSILNSGTLLGSLTGANFNSTADQAIALSSTSYIVEKIIVTNASVSLTTAAGGVYTAVSKSGAIVAAGQTYAALTAAAKYLSLTLTGAATTDRLTGGTIYLSLTTGQGSAATADVYVFGTRLN